MQTVTQGSMVWFGVKTLLVVLESRTDAFGPLKSAIGELNKYISIYESASKGRKNYAKLSKRLDGLLSNLARYINGQVGLEMTNAVNRLCSGIEAELKHLEEQQVRSELEELASSMEALDKIYQCYCRIEGYLERLTLNANMKTFKDIDKIKTESLLTGLSPAMAAVYNSGMPDEVGRGNCTPGTREPQIELLLEWARGGEAGRTCWMNGVSGTGKTTIAYSVCAKLDKTFELGASFFCSRLVSECRQISRIIPSIAYQFARFSLPFRYTLACALVVDPNLPTRGLNIQYRKLIVEPLLKVQKSLPRDLVVIIDALDECENEDSVAQILDLILSTEPTVPIRIFISSRSEPGVTQRMARLDEQGGTKLVLHNLGLELVRPDIEAYMRHELQHVPLTDTQWLELIDRCGTLFIYASTACRYIEHGYDMDTLDEAVSTIIGSRPIALEPGDNDGIDNLYLAILATAFDRPDVANVNKTRMKDLLETVICAIEPIKLDALVGLIGLKGSEQVELLLQPLRSVLKVANTTGLVTPLHASFSDFILAPERSFKFHCKQKTRHSDLTKACLRMIENVKPGFNICGLLSSCLLDDELEDLEERVSQAISPGLIYACRYWAAHLSRSEYHEASIEFVHDFFSARLLLWMEILNLTQLMRHGTSIVCEVEKWCSKHAVPKDIAALVQDAWQFVSVYANHPVSRSTPHIYTSMLPFWPQSRPISRAYMPRTLGMIKATGTAITRRQISLLTTWKVLSGSVYSLSVSSDGTRLAANTGRTIEILDISTGGSILSLTPNHKVLLVSISPNNAEVIFCCEDSSVYLWDTRHGGKVTEVASAHLSKVRLGAFSPDWSRVAFDSGNGDVYLCILREGGLVLGPLKGHSRAVTSFAFSPDGLYFASGSRDKTIRIWDAITGVMVGNSLQGHAGQVWSVSYSPDGSRLASASDDNSIRIWDPQTGQTVLGLLKEPSFFKICVSFSPNGRFIVLGSGNRTIQVYDAQTGRTALGPLQGHTQLVNSVVFSPDSTRLFSSSDDGTVRAWNVLDIHVPVDDVPQNVTSLPEVILCVRYSRSGSRIACGCGDSSIYIWDVQTCEMVLGPLSGHTDWIWSIDYSPNDAYIASASGDSTLRIWDACDGRDLHGAIRGHDGEVNSVRFSPDGSLVASGSKDGTMRIWDVKSGQQVMKLLEENDIEGRDGIWSIGFSPDGQRLVCGSEKGIMRVLDRYTGRTVVGPLQAHDSVFSSVEFSPDGSRILSGSWDTSIRMWDPQTGKQVLAPNDPSLEPGSYVSAATFSSDGQFIVSSYFGGNIRLWDAQSGDLVFGPLKGHPDAVRSAQFSPNGSHIASCSDDGGIRFWDVSSCREMAQKGEGQGRSPLSSRILSLDPVHLQLDPDYGKTEGSSQHAYQGYGLWNVNGDGWVVDQRKRRLVWVPSDLRGSLRGAFNDSIITDKPWVQLEFDGARIDEEWTDCYHP